MAFGRNYRGQMQLAERPR